jgi:hypothetical protein
MLSLFLNVNINALLYIYMKLTKREGMQKKGRLVQTENSNITQLSLSLPILTAS